MSLSWIDNYVDGVTDYCSSRDIYEIYNTLNIVIKYIDKDDALLAGDEAIYIRNYFCSEVVFIRDDLSYQYEKFVLCHELGHAVLHVEIAQAAYSNKLNNRGKLERQANYFAFKLLDIKLDTIYHDGLSTAQIAKDLCVTEDVLGYLTI